MAQNKPILTSEQIHALSYAQTGAGKFPWSGIALTLAGGKIASMLADLSGIQVTGFTSVGPASGTGEVATGSFSIFNWSGYPAGIPKPEGTARLIAGEEYATARQAANSANAEIRSLGVPPNSQVHEIMPVKFGGDPVSHANKIVLPTSWHQEVTHFWNQVLRTMTMTP